MSEKKKSKKEVSRFAKTERAYEPTKEEVDAVKNVGNSICPCGETGIDYRCKKCGATKHINPVSGNLIWMKSGRIVPGGAFNDEKEAYVKMAINWNIPKEQWPVQFR